jgi:D-alanine-D-alanine ligase
MHQVSTVTEPLKVGVFFGSRSVEHEVSVITAQQAMAAMPADRFIPVPVYITKTGAWYTGEQLLQLERYKDIDRLIAASTRVTMRPDPTSGGELLEVDARRGLLGGSARAVARFDVAMPLVHGSNGEDGTLQGLFELAALPYCGCDVASAAVSMDKRLSRTTLRGAGLPVLDDVMVSRGRWLEHPDVVCADLARHPRFPMYVKPRRLGSSIGVARVDGEEQLRDALEVAFGYDTSILAEPAQDGSIEINCSVLGWGDDVQVSVCEQPVSSGTLSYADKYLSGAKGKGGAKAPAAGMKSSQRLIPAPISESLTGRIQDAAMASFRAIGAAGVTRVDFLVSPEGDSFVVNELNTLPGSLSFYLWEASGMRFEALLTRLIDIATARHREQQATTSSIDTWLLTGRPA